MTHRPFETIEDFLFHEEIIYSKLNKKAVDVLIRVKALDHMADDRFMNAKHFWTVVAVNRPKNRKKLKELIEEHKDVENFSRDENIENAVALSGIYPFDLVLDDGTKARLDYYHVPPISEFDPALGVAWFIPREVIQRKTITNRPYYIVKTIDNNSAMVDIKCWGINPRKDKVFLNRPYMAKLKHEEQWGFSSKTGLKDWRLLG
jgi:DNA polymerase III alpha subunit